MPLTPDPGPYIERAAASMKLEVLVQRMEMYCMNYEQQIENSSR